MSGNLKAPPSPPRNAAITVTNAATPPPAARPSFLTSPELERFGIKSASKHPAFIGYIRDKKGNEYIQYKELKDTTLKFLVPFQTVRSLLSVDAAGTYKWERHDKADVMRILMRSSDCFPDWIYPCSNRWLARKLITEVKKTKKSVAKEIHAGMIGYCSGAQKKSDEYKCPTTFVSGFTIETMLILTDQHIGTNAPAMVEMLVEFGKDSCSCVHAKGRPVGQLRASQRKQMGKELHSNKRAPNNLRKERLSARTSQDRQTMNVAASGGVPYTKSVARSAKHEYRLGQLKREGFTNNELANILIGATNSKKEDIAARLAIRDRTTDCVGCVRYGPAFDTNYGVDTTKFEILLYTKNKLMLYTMLSNRSQHGVVLHLDLTGSLYDIPNTGTDASGKFQHGFMDLSPVFQAALEGLQTQDKAVRDFISPFMLFESVSNKNRSDDIGQHLCKFAADAADQAKELGHPPLKPPLIVNMDCAPQLHTAVLQTWCRSMSRIEYSNILVCHLSHFDYLVSVVR